MGFLSRMFHSADGHADLIHGLAGDTPVEGAFIVSVHGGEVRPVEYVE